MALNEQKVAEFKERLRDMSDQEIRLGLDTGTIALAWKRSLAEQELERREQEGRETSELARLQRENDRLSKALSDKTTGLRYIRWGLWLTGAGLVVSVVAHLFR